MGSVCVGDARCCHRMPRRRRCPGCCAFSALRGGLYRLWRQRGVRLRAWSNLLLYQKLEVEDRGWGPNPVRDRVRVWVWGICQDRARAVPKIPRYILRLTDSARAELRSADAIAIAALLCLHGVRTAHLARSASATAWRAAARSRTSSRLGPSTISLIRSSPRFQTLRGNMSACLRCQGSEHKTGAVIAHSIGNTSLLRTCSAPRHRPKSQGMAA